MKNTLKWQKTQLKPEESFEKGNYEELLKYVKENENQLMTAFFNDDTSAINPMLKYGSEKMDYFEKVIQDNPMFYALFKLGELNGHLTVFNAIKYNEQVISLTKAKFETFKSNYPSYAALSNAILKQLYKSGKPGTLENIVRALNTKKKLIRDVLSLLTLYGFINHYSLFGIYSLSDTGIIIAKQI